MNRSSRSAAYTAIVHDVAKIYQWLGIHSGPRPCLRCGRCCDLAGYGHRLFISSPEWIYHRMMNGPVLPVAKAGTCPFNRSGLCTIYEHRFAGCRIFLCMQDQDSQSRLSESALAMLKTICQAYQLEYRYVDLFDALSGRLSDIYP